MRPNFILDIILPLNCRRKNTRFGSSFSILCSKKKQQLTVASGRAWTTQLSSTSICSPSRWYQFCSISISGGSVIGKIKELIQCKLYISRHLIGIKWDELVMRWAFFLILQKIGQKGPEISDYLVLDLEPKYHELGVWTCF